MCCSSFFLLDFEVSSFLWSQTVPLFCGLLHGAPAVLPFQAVTVSFSIGLSITIVTHTLVGQSRGQS